LRPDILLSSVDADVSKTYVALGLAIAVFVNVAFDPSQDRGLRQIDARHLFKPSYLNILLSKNTILRNYMFEFARMFAPKLRKSYIEEALFANDNLTVPDQLLPELP